MAAIQGRLSQSAVCDPIGALAAIVYALPFLLLLTVVNLRAECINPPPPCPQLNSSGAVFYGEVLDVVWSESRMAQEVQFKVVRAFKGVNVGQWFGTFEWARENYTFHTGERVVVYATFRNGQWNTACNRTRAFAPRDKALLESEMAGLKVCAPSAPAH